MLRQSSCISLSSQRTLRDYTHYVSMQVVFSTEVDQLLIKSVNLSIERNRYVALVMDEVHIRDDLVYDKHNRKFVWFVNLSGTNNCLLDFKSSLMGSTTHRQLAKSMLVLIVRGLFARINFPYSQFACNTLTGELLVDPVCEALSHLERQEIHVMALTCDRASTNRRLWKIHSQEERFTYKVPNIFAADGPRSVYFSSHPPHLVKTARNCWWKSKRNLSVRIFVNVFVTIPTVYFLWYYYYTNLSL